jgi:hypothetical protein
LLKVALLVGLNASENLLLALASGLLGGGGGSGGLLARLGGLGDQHLGDVGQDTTLSDGDTAEKLVELLIVADRQLDVAGDDASLLVVAGSVAGKLKNLSSEVLEDGSEVHGGTSANSGGELALLQEAADSANRELKTSLGALGLRFLAVRLSTATLSTLSCGCCFACHFVRYFVLNCVSDTETHWR